LQDLSPGDVLISVPLACTVHYIDEQQQQQQQQQEKEGDGSESSESSQGNDSNSSRLAALRRLQRSVPAASDSGRGAWQFKVALEVRPPAAAVCCDEPCVSSVQPGCNLVLFVALCLQQQPCASAVQDCRQL
jgi:hypothetical protein